jgi:hypothetical protein
MWHLLLRKLIAVMRACTISLDSLMLARSHTCTNEAKLYIQHSTKAPIKKMRTSRVRYLVPPFADLTRCCAIRCNCTCARIALLTSSLSDTPSTSMYGDKSTHSRSSKAISGFAAIDSANTRCVSLIPDGGSTETVREDKAAHVCSSRCAIPYTQPRARSCIRACRHTKHKHACIPCTYTYLPSFQCTTQ